MPDGKKWSISLTKGTVLRIGTINMSTATTPVSSEKKVEHKVLG